MKFIRIDFHILGITLFIGVLCSLVGITISFLLIQMKIYNVIELFTSMSIFLKIVSIVFYIVLRYLDAAIEKACKIRYLLQTNLNDINTLIGILHTRIENSEDNEPTLFDKKELETKKLWVD